MSAPRFPGRLGEVLRFVKYLPQIYRSHTLECQRRFRGVDRDPRTLFFSRSHFLYAPNDVTAFRTWQSFFAHPSSAAEVKLFLELRTGCSQFLDIGAAQGLFSALFARTATGPARIVGVEPTRAYSDLFRETLASNAKLEIDWSVYQTALMNENRAALLSDSVFEGFFLQPCGSGIEPAQELSLATLDRFCDELGFIPDLVKMDVDGFEYEILMGAPDFLRRHRPKIHLEVHFADLARRGKDANQLLTIVFKTHRILRSVPTDYRSATVARLALVPLD